MKDKIELKQCKDCHYSTTHDNQLYCKLRIKDKPTESAKVKECDCNWFRVK